MPSFLRPADGGQGAEEGRPPMPAVPVPDAVEESLREAQEAAGEIDLVAEGKRDRLQEVLRRMDDGEALGIDDLDEVHTITHTHT